MGEVYQARDTKLNRFVAVKILKPDHSVNAEQQRRFIQEAQAASALNHPNIIVIHDIVSEEGAEVMIMEYVPGTDLRRLIRSRGALTIQQAAKVIMQAAIGLEYAHRRGLIHRDVKPGNILVTPEGVAKVSDLGLAGFMHEGDEDPRAGKIVGTADYLSPEQILTPREVTCASDIYSLGCTLYYAVCAKVPFPGGTSKDKARRHVEETPWHPRRFKPDISEEFVEIIADMMEKDPATRIQSAQEVANRLEPWAVEASPLPSEQMTKSRWMAPPPPTDREADGERRLEVDLVGADLEEMDSRSAESPSQFSQATDPLVASRHDTKASRGSNRNMPEPPLTLSETEPETDEWSRAMCVAIALAIAIPVAMFFGAALTFVLLRLFQ